MANIITEKKFKFELPDGKKKERLDLYIAGSLENATRTRVQKLIEAGYVTVNGKLEKSNYNVRPKDFIEITIPCSPRPDTTEAEDIPITVVYEDEYFIIINKAAGMVVHPSLGHFSGTLVNALLHYSDKLSESTEDDPRPGIVHRIDKDTSGLLVVAKDEVTHAKLSALFAKHTIEREYYAIIWGRLKQQEGMIESFIIRSNRDRKKFMMSATEGKHATTYYKVLEEYDFLSLISLKLKTGRTHQIRVHMSGTGHPIFGDDFYGGREIHAGTQLPKLRARVDNLLELMPRQALHAKTLGFMHPRTGEMMHFDSALPDDMQQLLDAVRTQQPRMDIS
ncbi:MAG: RluA family pseudouridine synthase [Ignavibacteriales bacterium]|nr:RluA family pseudouridine synthase [Ignavibacteriales bacterium]